MNTLIIIAIGWFVFTAITFFMGTDEWSVDEQGVLIVVIIFWGILSVLDYANL